MDKHQCLKLISSSFFTKLSKTNMGASWVVSDTPDAPMMGVSQGASDAPIMPPMLYFSKNKNYLSNQMHSFFPRTKITWGGIRHYPPFIHHPQYPSPAHHTPHQLPIPPHPTTNPPTPPNTLPSPPHHPPVEKKWGLNA